MLEGLYSAGAGMEAAQQQLSAVSNNISNENTPGYQAQILGFHDLLYTTDNDAPSNALVGAGAGDSTLGFSQAQGSLQQTGNPLDLALHGPGYFQVRQPDGSTGLTRNGSFQLNSRGQLTTNLGMELVPPLTLPKGTQPSQVSISSDGTVSVANQKLGQIKIVQVSAPDKLLPQGNSVYTVTTASGPAQAARGVTMQQGYLEQSNVDLNTEISQMMTAQQAYNMGSRAVQMEAQLGQIAATLK
ncbi:MAG TPA: flagellar hook-basal body protein [Solirubrobacteraceae bacterium]|jgi:flagellar basal-body rod protein FlgG|nr:flagellar hook-basal body protein [Solirubrobacteraceae bacterium]